MDFTEDPFKDYRYEDPFNIDDPFADQPPRAASLAAFDADSSAFFSPPPVNGRDLPTRGGRASAPPLPTPLPRPDDSWAAFPDDNWAADDAWAAPKTETKPDVWTTNTKKDASSKTDNWASKTAFSTKDDWANKTDNRSKDDWADWSTDHNKNLNETWPSSTLPNKKEKSPKPVKYAKSLVHTIGGIGRSKKNKQSGSSAAGGTGGTGGTGGGGGEWGLPSEEQQWAWAAAESRRLQAAADAARRQEDAELQLALAISRQEK